MTITSNKTRGYIIHVEESEASKLKAIIHPGLWVTSLRQSSLHLYLTNVGLQLILKFSTISYFLKGLPLSIKCNRRISNARLQLCFSQPYIVKHITFHCSDSLTFSQNLIYVQYKKYYKSNRGSCCPKTLLCMNFDDMLPLIRTKTEKVFKLFIIFHLHFHETSIYLSRNSKTFN